MRKQTISRVFLYSILAIVLTGVGLLMLDTCWRSRIAARGYKVVRWRNIHIEKLESGDLTSLQKLGNLVFDDSVEKWKREHARAILEMFVVEHDGSKLLKFTDTELKLLPRASFDTTTKEFRLPLRETPRSAPVPIG